MTKSFRKLRLTLALLTLSLSFAACGSYDGDPYYAAWFNAYGEPCGYNVSAPYPGCNYFSYGLKIRAWQDPFSYQWQQGQYWMSPTGIWYDPAGYALNSVSDEQSADVISAASEENKTLTHIAAKNLSDQYALNEANATQIAQSLQAWSSLGTIRKRTQADIADFSERLYGVKSERIIEALTNAEFSRNLQPVEELNIDVAAFWGTTPETSKAILRKWHQGELNRYMAK